MPVLAPADQARVQKIRELRASPKWATIDDGAKAKIQSYLSGLVSQPDTSSLRTDGTPGPAFREEQDYTPPVPVVNAIGVPGTPNEFVGNNPVSAMPPAETTGGDILAGLNRGGPLVSQQVSGAMATAGQYIPGALGRRLTEYGTQGVDMAQGAIDQFPAPRTIAGQVAEATPGLLGAVGVGLATAGAGLPAVAGTLAGAGAVGAQTAGGTFVQTRDRLGGQGAPQELVDQAAAAQALPSGIFGAITGTLPIGRILGRVMPGASVPLGSAMERFASTPVGRRLVEAAVGGSQNAAQEVFNNALRIVAEDDPATADNILRGAGQAALMGGLMTAGTAEVVGALGGREQALPASTPEVEATTRAGTPGVPPPPAETGTPAGVSGQTAPRDGIVPVTSAEALDAARAIRERQTGRRDLSPPATGVVAPTDSAPAAAPPTGTIDDVRAFAAAKQQREAIRQAAADLDAKIASALGLAPGTDVGAVLDRATVKAEPSKGGAAARVPVQSEGGSAEALLNELRAMREGQAAATTQIESNPVPADQASPRAATETLSPQLAAAEEVGRASIPASPDLTPATSLDSMTPAQLRREAKARGVDSRGTKAQLLERLKTPPTEAPKEVPATTPRVSPPEPASEALPVREPSSQQEAGPRTGSESTASPNPTPATGAKEPAAPRTIEQRLLDFADRMKQERAQTPDPRRAGSKPGQRTGTAPIFKDTVTLAAELAARAAAKGIQAAKAVHAFVHEQMGAKDGDPEARRVTRIVRGILSDSVKDGKVDYDAFESAANAARQEAARTSREVSRAKKEASRQDKADARNELRLQAEQANDAAKRKDQAQAIERRGALETGRQQGTDTTLDRVVPKAVREVKRAYREGRAREAAVTAPALESMERVIKAIPKRTKAAMELARRGGADEAKAAQDVRDAMRKQVLDMAGDAPPEVRGRLLKTLADADTPGKMLKAMRSVQRDTYRAKARGDWAWINRKSKPGKVKGMTGRTEPFVQEMATLRAHAETAKKVIRQKDVSLTDARAATEMLSKIRDEMGAKIKQAQSAHEVIKGMRGLTAIHVAENARQKVEAKSKEADVEGEAKTPDENRALGIVRSIGDIRNSLQRVEGPNGPIKEVVYDRIAPAESKAASIERDSLKEAEALARDVGYKDLDELEAALSPNSGKGVTKTITVQLAGVQRKITLGEALDLYGHATDSETASLMAGNQQFVPERGRGTVRMDVNPNDMIALRLQLEQEAPGLVKWIDGHKKLLQDLRVEERKVIYRLTGKEPIDPPTRWWRERVMEQAPYVKDTSPGPAKFDFAALLETAGVNKDRVQTDSVPILLRNPVAKLRDEIRRSSKTIALAEPIRDAFNVLSQRDLAESINKRFGTETLRRLEKQLTALYADPPPPDGGGRFAAAANSTLHVTALAGNPGSMAGNAVGAIRIIPELPAQHLAGAIKDLATKPRELFNDLRERSGLFWEQFNRPYQERSSATGAAGPVRSDAGFVREMRRAGLNIKAGDVGAAFGDVKNAMKSTLSLYNLMDAPSSILAYAGKIRESKEIHPGWTEGQHKDWAAAQAEQIIRDTQPSNRPLDAAFAPTAARGTVQSGLFTFQGDIMRTRNRIAAAFGESREHGIKVLSSEVANIVVSRVTKRLVNAGLLVAAYAAFGVSNDEKKKELAKALDPKEVGIALGKDVGDLVFPQLGSAVAGAVGAAGRAMGKPNLVPMPGVDAVEEAGAAVLHMGQQIATAIERGIKGKTIDTGKLLKSIRDGGTELVNVGVGNPLSPILRKVYKAYDVAQGEADPRKIIAAYRADSGILEADKAKRDVREDIWDAIAENDTAKARRAFNNAKAEKVPLSSESLKELIRGKHPLAGVPEKDRPKFIASLSPEKKRAMEKAIKEYEVQRNRAGRVIQEAIK